MNKTQPFRTEDRVEFKYEDCSLVAVVRLLLLLLLLLLKALELRQYFSPMGRWLTRYREARRAAGHSGGPHDVQQSPVRGAPVQRSPPRGEEFDAIATRGVAAIVDGSRCDNTDRAYRTKIFEYFEYADYERPNLEEAVRYVISEQNIRRYVWYVSFRKKRQGGTGSRKKRKDIDAQYLYFIPSEFEELRTLHQQHDAGNESPPDPENGVKYSEMEQTKYALKKLYEEQIADGVNSRHWDQVWTLPIKDIMLMVKRRENRVDKAGYVEKMNHFATPYILVGKLKDIEHYIWMGGYTNRLDTLFSTLRNRYIFNRSKQTLGRGETFHNEELSDMFLVDHQGQKDPHMMEIFVSQVARGKTNRDHKIFSRSIRHKDVFLCGTGALAFYLFFRFHHTKEFDPPNVPDFTDSKQWFDIKTLVALHDPDSYTKGIADTNYSTYIKTVLQALGLPTNFMLHLGRKVGAVELEMMELDVALLKTLGNWNMSVFDKAYSAKLPIEALRMAAAFIDGYFFCARTVVVTDLLEQIEATFWLFVEENLVNIEREFLNNMGELKLFTAYAWLTFMKRLKRVLIQDAAYILEFHPERAQHPIFQMELFNTDLFKQYRREMRAGCEAEVSPLDASMDRVLPGVLQGLRANLQANQLVLANVNGMRGEMRHGLQAIRRQIDGSRQRLGQALVDAGGAMQEDAGDGDSDIDTAALGDSNVAANETQQSTAARVSFSGLPASTANARARDDGAPFAGYGYVPKWDDMNTVQSVYDQWYGMGLYKNVPIAGGLFQMEFKHKTKWRTEWTKKTKEAKKFSRMKKVMEEHKRLRDTYSYSPAQAIAVMEAALKQRKGSLTAFADDVRKIPEAEFYGDVPQRDCHRKVHRGLEQGCRHGGHVWSVHSRCRSPRLAEQHIYA